METQLPHPQKGSGAPSPIFGPCLVWQNGRMDQDGTWHGRGPWSRPHCVRGGPSFRERGIAAPTFRPMSIVATVAHLSYCWAIVLYGLEACPLKKLILDHSTLSSTVYSWNYLVMVTVRECQQFFNFDLVSVTVVNRAANFESKLNENCNNMLLL